MSVQTFSDYRDAQAAAADAQMGVGGALKGRDPVYFLYPLDADDDTIRDLAFEARSGRPMSDGERRLWAVVNDQMPGVLDPSDEDLKAALS